MTELFDKIKIALIEKRARDNLITDSDADDSKENAATALGVGHNGS
jgi:hypothetical protein